MLLLPLTVFLLLFQSPALGDICRSSHCLCLPPLDPHDVHCTGDFLSVIPQDLPPYMVNLSITRTQIRQGDSTLGHYDQLIALDLSHNQINSIHSHAFSRLSQLESLSLEGNRLEAIGAHSLSGLFHLRSLNIKDNHLWEISPNSVMKDVCVSLTHLDISKNKLAHLDGALFKECIHLSYLDLSFNHLTSLGTLDIPSLKTLKLNGNHLDSLQNLSSPSFSRLRSLERLSLNKCGLRSLSMDFFEGLRSLEYLSMEDNLFRRLPFGRGEELMGLRELRMGSNYLEGISIELRGLSRLRSLSISGCDSKGEFFIDPDAFANNTRLRNLSISHCSHLQRLPPGLFRPLTQLRSLQLRDTGLRTLSALHAHWSALPTLDLSFTRLKCDCALSWILENNHMSSLLESSNASCLEKGEKSPLISILVELKCDSSQGFLMHCLLFAMIGGIVVAFLCFFCVCRSKPPRKRIRKGDISVITQNVSNPSEYKDVLYYSRSEEKDTWRRERYADFPDVKTSVL